MFGSLRGEGIEGMRGKEGKWDGNGISSHYSNVIIKLSMRKGIKILPLFGCFKRLKCEEDEIIRHCINW